MPFVPPIAGPCILTIACFDRSSTLQTEQVLLDSRPPPLNAPSLASETPLKPRTIIFLSFHPPHLHPPSPSIGLSQSFSVLVRKAQRDPVAPGCVCFHNCLAEHWEQPVSSALSTTERLKQKGSLRNRVLISVSPSPTKPQKCYVSILVDLLNRLTTAVQR